MGHLSRSANRNLRIRTENDNNMALNKEKVAQNQIASDLFFVVAKNIGKKLLLQRSPNAFFLKINNRVFH